MGLLLGRWEQDGAHAIVENAIVLSRSDRKKDRVEVAYEQLAAASEAADKHSERTGRPCRVIGWYHSHPHITVHPSHVDVKTQGQYQAMDSAFLGLIFSVFSEDPTNLDSTVEVTAFQATMGEDPTAYDPAPNCTCAVAELDASSSAIPGAFASHRSTCPVPNHQPSIGGGEQWRCRPVRLSVQANPNAEYPCMPAYHSLTEAFRALLRLQDVLFKEEQAAYRGALGVGTGGTGESRFWLQTLNASAVYQRALCDILDSQTLPLDSLLVATRRSLQLRMQKLQAENTRLRGGLTPEELCVAEERVDARLRGDPGEQPAATRGVLGPAGYDSGPQRSPEPTPPPPPYEHATSGAFGP